MLNSNPSQTIAQVAAAVTALLFPPACCLCCEPTEMDPISLRTPVLCRQCETLIGRTAAMLETGCRACGWPRGLGPSNVVASQAPTEAPTEVSAEVSADQVAESDCGVADTAAEDVPEDVPDVATCRRCESRKAKPAYDRVTPLYRYQDLVTTAIVAAKYPRNSAITRELAIRLATRCQTSWPELRSPDGSLSPIVTSVPSPWLRQARRGGSGTRLLAKYAARVWGLPYQPVLRTRRGIVKQAWLDDSSREDNVRDAFAVARPWPHRGGKPRPWEGRTVILVDDVLTTGATAHEASRVLMEAGASGVWVAVVALAMRDTNASVG